MYSTLAELLAQSGQEVHDDMFQRQPNQMSTISMTPHPTTSTLPNPQSFIDVHEFDYSYSHQHHKIVEMTDEEKRDCITQLMHLMKDPQAKQGSQLIVANIGMMGNRDHTNQKYAEDILVLLAQHMERDPSLLPLLEEQLVDMVQLGQCAQGRTTRLWQLYVSLPTLSS